MAKLTYSRCVICLYSYYFHSTCQCPPFAGPMRARRLSTCSFCRLRSTERGVTPSSVASSGIVTWGFCCTASIIFPDVFPDVFSEPIPGVFPGVSAGSTKVTATHSPATTPTRQTKSHHSTPSSRGRYSLRHREAVRPWRSMTPGLPRYARCLRSQFVTSKRRTLLRHREAAGRGDP